MVEKLILTPREVHVLGMTASAVGSLLAHVYMGFKEVTGEAVSLPEILRVLGQLDLPNVLRLLTRINNAFCEPSNVNPQLQAIAVSQLLDVGLRTALQRSGWGRSHNLAVFHRQQQLVLLRLALQCCPMTGGMDWGPPSAHVYGRASWMVNDILETPPPPSANADEELAIIAKILPHIEFASDLNTVANVTRSQRSWVASRAVDALKEEPDYLDFDKVFHERFGVSLDDYLTVVMALFCHYGEFSLAGEESMDRVVIRSETFLRNTSFSQETFERILSMISITPEELRKKLLYDPCQSVVWDFAIMRRYPLLKMEEGHYVCYDRGFLQKLLTDGVYWQIYHGLDEASKGGFRSFFGKVVAAQVNEVLRGMYGPPRGLVPFFLAGAKFEGTNDEVSDGLLDLGECLVIMEYKASPLSTRTKYSGDPAHLEWDLLERFVGQGRRAVGVRQLAASIARMARG